MEERQKEMQGGGRCATWEKLSEEKDKDRLEGEHRETGRREYKKGVNGETEMKNSKGHSWEKQKRAKGLFWYLLGGA